jgi:MarR family transcriptional regulator, organic hydroperoxide resistance regulator
MAQRYPQLELDNQLCFALYNASRAIVRSYTPHLEALGLTYPQYLTMLVLWETPDQPTAVGELGRRLHLDSGTLTPLLKRLEQADLVTRRRDGGDERRVLVGLTEQGLALRDRAAEVPAKVFAGYGMDLAAAVRLKDDLIRLVASVEGSTGG